MSDMQDRPKNDGAAAARSATVKKATMAQGAHAFNVAHGRPLARDVRTTDACFATLEASVRAGLYPARPDYTAVPDFLVHAREKGDAHREEPSHTRTIKSHPPALAPESHRRPTSRPHPGAFFFFFVARFSPRAFRRALFAARFSARAAEMSPVVRVGDIDRRPRSPAFRPSLRKSQIEMHKGPETENVTRGRKRGKAPQRLKMGSFEANRIRM